MKKIISMFVAVLMAGQFFIPNISWANNDFYNNDHPQPACNHLVNPVVTTTSNEDGVLVSWEKIDHPNFKGYKVVISQNNPHPKYSEDGYLRWITDKNVTSQLVNNATPYHHGDFGKYLKKGELYYFSVTAVYECGNKIAGNAKQEKYLGPERSEYEEIKNKIKEYKDVRKFCTGDNPKETVCFDSQLKTYQKPMIVKDKKLIEISKKARLLNENKLDDILSELKELRSVVKEQQAQIKYLKNLTSDLHGLAEQMKNAINDFITYGVDKNTQRLGAGERAAVIHSFKQAFGKLPTNEAELEDAIRIANGRWPGHRNPKAEQKAVAKFLHIYKRLPNFENKSDDAAVTIMTYGLRQRAENRKLESEQKGLKIFQNIFGYLPQTTEDWNAMQAITYSGAKR